jgi:hypothetical protein
MAKKRRIRTLPRDDDGAIRKRYFGRVVKAIETADVETLWRLSVVSVVSVLVVGWRFLPMVLLLVVPDAGGVSG